MCKQVVEYYAVCKCHYFTHGVDKCPNVGQKGHPSPVIQKTYVGTNCPTHST
ncbi:hypothetical protein B0T26DRAFT_649055 [Lasiosphaeria miniovina]|uniref:Uncharacterized protein n=1 Tax=Lasiosphaeria miniovina TaxID=1954250 RepID=A0AA40ABP4_9PEZI|nr:uncharacterized protein B0T26DRAFT_649055 [Lasiosphaeria miniovina]KAK0712947.1 hypothetical protein B0T26DRAFT_649055 [Lasiosphaeria miniovina]